MEQECCGMRKKERSPEEYKDLMTRLNRIEGQIKGIKGMVEKDAYCTDILIQIKAVSAALNGLNKKILENHLRTCIVTDLKNGREDSLEDLVSTLQKLMEG